MSAAELERNKHIVRRFKECQGTPGEAAALRDLVAPGYRRLRGGFANLAANARGEGFPAPGPGLRAALPDRADVIEDIIAEGDRVGLLWRVTGTHGGDLFGIPATGRRLDIWEIGIFRLADGRITEGWFMADEVGVLRQLGATLPARRDGTRVQPARPAPGVFAEEAVRAIEAEPPSPLRARKIVVARSKTPQPPPADRAQHTLRLWGMQHMRDYAEAHGVARFDPTSSLPDRRDHITGLLAEDDRVWMLFNLRGTHTASFYGLPPTGRYVEMAEVGRMRFDGERWAESWYYADGLGLLLQLDALAFIAALHELDARPAHARGRS